MDCIHSERRAPVATRNPGPGPLSTLQTIKMVRTLPGKLLHVRTCRTSGSHLSVCRGEPSEGHRLPHVGLLIMLFFANDNLSFFRMSKMLMSHTLRFVILYFAQQLLVGLCAKYRRKTCEIGLSGPPLVIESFAEMHVRTRLYEVFGVPRMNISCNHMATVNVTHVTSRKSSYYGHIAAIRFVIQVIQKNYVLYSNTNRSGVHSWHSSLAIP
jgi:hypothetical protein